MYPKKDPVSRGAGHSSPQVDVFPTHGDLPLLVGAQTEPSGKRVVKMENPLECVGTCANQAYLRSPHWGALKV